MGKISRIGSFFMMQGIYEGRKCHNDGAAYGTTTITSLGWNPNVTAAARVLSPPAAPAGAFFSPALWWFLDEWWCR